MHFRFKLELFRKPSQNPKQHQYNTTYIIYLKVLGKVWPGFKNKYDLDIYDMR